MIIPQFTIEEYQFREFTLYILEQMIRFREDSLTFSILSSAVFDFIDFFSSHTSFMEGSLVSFNFIVHNQHDEEGNRLVTLNKVINSL